MLTSRDDKIRTCDHTPPRRVLYRAELHPELRVQMYGFILKQQIFIVLFLLNEPIFCSFKAFGQRVLLFFYSYACLDRQWP